MPLFAGHLLLEGETLEGWVEAEAGRCVAWGEGKPDGKPTATGWIVPSPVNAHTHVADAFLRDRPGKPATVAELVGPNGWKARSLAGAKPEEIVEGILRYTQEMAAVGTTHFMDFREGGLQGVRFLRGLAKDLPVAPIILGRPLERDFKPEEARALLAEADGIGLSAMRDFERAGDVEAWAETCHKARKPFALHASEAKREDMEAILALEPAFVVHATQATQGDFEDIADAGATVVVCPRSSAHYGMKSPVGRMVAAGVKVAVGTDNGMLHDGDLRADLALLHSWHPKLATEDLLRMATWSARALARLPPAFPLREGKPLDVVVLPQQPWQRPASGKPGFALAGPP